jgi:asparagine synthase (glutamine-hydrolysing)
MSGFVGILNLDGAPVDRALLEKMTQALAFRGPDALNIWCDGSIGIGHALLQIPPGTTLEKQPTQLDERLWIATNARIDAREELIARLKAKCRTADALSLSTPDAELILHAYDIWGEACVEHLLGDFSFALWDALRKRLFCARDQMGLKQLYYAQAGSCLVFGNTLGSIRLHPGVSGRLDDLAIADFLLFEMNQDPAGTSFSDIRQLPPAHVLACEQGNISVRRYWELPAAAPIRLSHDADYVERFRELLDLAVGDRLRGSSAGVLMSGGLDSTAVAASAQRVLGRAGIAEGVRAHTEVFDSLIPHEERRYATLAANAMKIPIEFLVSDNRKIFERGDTQTRLLPLPILLAWPDASPDQLPQIAAHSRIALTGFGADPALSAPITLHFRQLLAQRRFGRALTDAARYLTRPGRMSRLYLRHRWQRLFPSKKSSVSYPQWLNPDLEKKLSLRERWEGLGHGKPPNQSARPLAYELIASPGWVNLFESMDPNVTQMPVEVVNPFFNLPLLQFLLGLPSLPWCCDKQILREDTRGSLPEVVRLRRKSPLSVDPLNAVLQKPESAWVDHFEPVEELRVYVSRERIPPVYGEKDPWSARVHLRPLSLNFWLRHKQP